MKPYFLQYSATLAGSASLNDQRIKNTSGGDLTIVALSITSTGNFSFQLNRDSESMMNGNIQKAALVSSENPSVRFPAPFVIPADQEITVSLLELSTAENAIHLVLWGYVG